MTLLARLSWIVWWLRQMLGDAAYENYLRHACRDRRAPGELRPLSREEYYLDALRRRYTGISRCC